MRSVVTGLVLVALIASVAACDSAARTPRPSPSLIILDFSPRPSGTATASASPGTSVVARWPLGWDASFCAMFSQAVDAQQLLVDVERAMADGDNHDARLLADELTQSATGAEDAIAAMPEWSDAMTTLIAIAGLMDLGSRAGIEYHAWFADGKRAALRRARDLRTENGTQVPGANQGLADLAEAGLACQIMPLVLEAPG